MRVYVPDECFKNYKQYNAKAFSKMFDDLLNFLGDKGLGNIDSQNLNRFFKKN